MLRPLIAALCGLLLLTATACGSETNPEGSGTPEPTDTQTSSPDPSPDPSPEPTETVGPSGDAVTVGDWDVVVTEFNPDADDLIADVDGLTDNPPPEGRYVLVTYEATYVGSESSAGSYMALYWDFEGADGNEYEEAFAVTTPLGSGGGVAPGEVDTGQIAMDIAPGAIDGGRLFVRELVGDPIEIPLG